MPYPSLNITIPGELGGYPVEKAGMGFYRFGESEEIYEAPASIGKRKNNEKYDGWDDSVLEKLTFDDSVSVIPPNFFSEEGCDLITIPDSVSAIGDRAFYKCKTLYEINIPGSVKEIGDHAFYKCGTAYDEN